MVVKSKGKGKFDASRVITCVKIVDTAVHLLTIYDKSEKENITNEELAKYAQEESPESKISEYR